jgi:hypothetical protein
MLDFLHTVFFFLYLTYYKGVKENRFVFIADFVSPNASFFSYFEKKRN